MTTDRVQDGRHLMNAEEKRLAWLDAEDRWYQNVTSERFDRDLALREREASPLVFHRDAFSLVWPMPEVNHE